MQRFTEMQGRSYEAVVTLATVIRLKKELQVDLNDVGTGDLLERITGDAELLVNVLWVLVEKSAQAHGITDAEFGAALGGDSLAEAVDAMLDAIADFFRPSQRTALKKMLSKGREVEALALQQVTNTIDSLSPETILTSLTTAGSSPESSALTRGS